MQQIYSLWKWLTETICNILQLGIDVSNLRQKDRRTAGSGRSVEFCLESKFEWLHVVVQRSQKFRQRLDKIASVFLQIGGSKEEKTKHLRHVGSTVVRMIHLESKWGKRETS